MKYKLLLTALFVMLAACNQVSDPNETSLAPVFGTAGIDFGRALATNSLGVYIVGTTEGNLHRSNLGGEDIYIRKYNRQGKFLWGRQFGSQGYDTVHNVAADSADNAYMTYTTNSPVGFIRKYSATGRVLWIRRIGIESSGYGVAASNSSVYVTGTTTRALARPVRGESDAFIRKYSASGKLLWTRQFGDSRSDAAGPVAVDSRGYVTVVGASSSDSPYEYEADMFVLNYSPSGRLLWSKRIDSPLHDSYFPHEWYVGAVAVSGRSIYIGVDHTYSVDDGIESFYTRNELRILKYDTSGTQLWDKQLGQNLNPTYNYLKGLSADDSGVFFGGVTYHKWGELIPTGPFVTKLDSQGNQIWSTPADSLDPGKTSDVAIGRRNEVYATGTYANGTDSEGRLNYDAFLQRFDSVTGTITWTR